MGEELELVRQVALAALIFVGTVLGTACFLHARAMRDYGSRLKDMRGDLIYQVIQKRTSALPYKYPYQYRGYIMDRRMMYYEALGEHLYPDCKVPDWRVVEVAIAYDIPAELALDDAVEKGFM